MLNSNHSKIHDKQHKKIKLSPKPTNKNCHHKSLHIKDKKSENNICIPSVTQHCKSCCIHQKSLKVIKLEHHTPPTIFAIKPLTLLKPEIKPNFAEIQEVFRKIDQIKQNSKTSKQKNREFRVERPNNGREKFMSKYTNKVFSDFLQKQKCMGKPKLATEHKDILANAKLKKSDSRKGQLITKPEKNMPLLLKNLQKQYFASASDGMQESRLQNNNELKKQPYLDLLCLDENEESIKNINKNMMTYQGKESDKKQKNQNINSIWQMNQLASIQQRITSEESQQQFNVQENSTNFGKMKVQDVKSPPKIQFIKQNFIMKPNKVCLESTANTDNTDNERNTFSFKKNNQNIEKENDISNTINMFEIEIPKIDINVRGLMKSGRQVRSSMSRPVRQPEIPLRLQLNFI